MGDLITKRSIIYVVMEICRKCEFTCNWRKQSFKLVITSRTPPSALSVEVRYERMMEMFGMKGYFCKTIPELQRAIKESLQLIDMPTIINVAIDPASDRKPQSFHWLTESKL